MKKDFIFFTLPKIHLMKNICREDFIKFFRDDEKLNELKVNDRVEIFRTILVGSSDITKELLDEFYQIIILIISK